MAVDSVSDFQKYQINPNKLSTSSVIMGKDATQLGMDDFFNLLVAQITNQDMLNPMEDTEFISQMAMFSALQGIQTIQEYQLASYAASYVGKNVVIAHTGDDGKIVRTEGFVDSVSYYDGEPKVIIKNTSYPLYSVMEVKNKLSTDTGKTDDTDETDDDKDKTDETDKT